MLPALLLIQVSQGPRITIPLPFFILWPLILVVWLGAWIAWLVASPSGRSGTRLQGLRTACLALFHLRGLLVDVRGRDGREIYLRFV